MEHQLTLAPRLAGYSSCAAAPPMSWPGRPMRSWRPATPWRCAFTEAARERGLLTIALAGGDGGQIAASKAADHVLLTPSADPRVVKELQVTAYHVLWELVHVFFEQPGVLGPGVVT